MGLNNLLKYTSNTNIILGFVQITCSLEFTTCGSVSLLNFIERLFYVISTFHSKRNMEVFQNVFTTNSTNE